MAQKGFSTNKFDISKFDANSKVNDSKNKIIKMLPESQQSNKGTVQPTLWEVCF